MSDKDGRLPVRNLHERATVPTDDDNTIRQTGIQGTNDDTVHAMDVAIFDENGDKFSQSNPLPVVNVSNSSEGTPVHDWNQEVDLAKDATVNHDLAAGANGFRLAKIWASASIKIKVSVLVGVLAGTPVEKYTAFNSVSNPNVCIPILEDLDVPNGEGVRVTIENLDNEAADVYSTIEGEQLS